MKKVFLFVFALLAIGFSSKAQTLLSEGFENGSIPAGWTIIDNDGDSQNWYIPTTDVSEYTHSGTGLVTSASWISTGALTPDNWLITPAIALTSNATLSFWVDGQDPSYPAENYSVYVATSNTVAAFLATTPVLNAVATDTWEQKTVDLSNYTGQTVYIAFRHHNISDMFRINLDDIEVFAQPTTPTILANPATLTFVPTAIGATSAAQTITVNGYNLTDPISVTVSAGFVTTTATIPANGGLLEISAEPVINGAYTGFAILTSGNVVDTIMLSAEGVDCSGSINTLPWTEDFESNVFPPLCWDLITVGTNTWEAYSYNGFWASCSGDDEGTQNEQLITRTFDFTNYTHSILMDLDFMSNYTYVMTDTVDFVVYASTDGGTTFNTTPIWKLSDFGQFTNWTPTTATMSLSSLAGQSNVVLKFAYEGLRCQVLFDNIHIYALDEPTVYVVDTVNFYAEVGTTNDQTVTITAYNMSEGFVATTDAPYSVSLDGTTYSTSVTVPAEGGELFVRFTGVNGIQNGTLTLTSGSFAKTLTLIGEGYSCGAFPVSENFNHNGFTPGCWTLVYGDNDPTVNPMTVLAASANNDGDYVFRFSSYSQSSNYNQYLISPEITDTESELMISFLYAAYGLSNENFKVGYSTTGNNPSDFTWLSAVVASNTAFETYAAAIPQGTKYVAIDYYSNYAYYLFVDDIVIDRNNSVADHAESAVKVYPNPAGDFLNIAAEANILSVEVFNMAGQKVIAVDANDSMTTLNTSNLSRGMYTVRINTVNGTINQKFAVAR